MQMTVQELINELMKIEDKSKKVVVDCCCGITSVEQLGEDVELRY